MKPNSSASAFISIKTRYRKYFLMLADLMIISFSNIFAWIILMRRIPIADHFQTILLGGLCFVAIFFFAFLIFGMYESIWRYAEAYEFIKCMMVSMLATGIFIIVTWFCLQPPYVPTRMPITVYFLSALMAGGGTLFLRMAYRVYRITLPWAKKTSGAKKAMIVGAGQAGSLFLHELKHDPKQHYEVVCIVDDNISKVGRKIQHVKVESTTESIPALVSKYGIEVIILAIPSISNKDKQRITNICLKTKCQLKKVPEFYAFVTDASPTISQIKNVNIEDLLGREVINIEAQNPNYLTDKVVMVTGAGGSIGSELCRQVAIQRPKRLVMVDISETGLYDIQQELLRGRGSIDKVSLYAEVASVQDKDKMELLFQRHSPEIVYHAAAYKHVPLMESVPEEAVKNNIFGTFNVAYCADKYGVKRFVMISTDKAVNPSSVMGATKRVCEMIIQSMAKVSKTGFIAVRFGNVLDSNGSVIPLFKAQIAAGGPVTVTHKDITRYFMTISEAVSLVLTAGEIAHGGEIFVLDMGEPVKILDLAELLIQLSGYEPYKDINIQFIGLRPGEKLYEELLMGEEGLKKTANKKIFIGKPIDISPDYLSEFLKQLKMMADENDVTGLVEKLQELVKGYREERVSDEN